MRKKALTTTTTKRWRTTSERTMQFETADNQKSFIKAILKVPADSKTRVCRNKNGREKRKENKLPAGQKLNKVMIAYLQSYANFYHL